MAKMPDHDQGEGMVVNPNLYGGGGQICPQAVFLLQLQNGWR